MSAASARLEREHWTGNVPADVRAVLEERRALLQALQLFMADARTYDCRKAGFAALEKANAR